MAPLDYEALALSLAPYRDQLLFELLPGGRMKGQYYECGSIKGGKGDSFKFNLDSSLWKDFASGDQAGKDIISLYAAVNGISNHDAAVALQNRFLGGMLTRMEDKPEKKEAPKKALQMQGTPVLPPPEAPKPEFELAGRNASMTWEYKSPAGDRLFYIARFEKAEGGKDFFPYTWNGTKWVMKSYPAPRPMYGLELLSTRPQGAVLLVEGEKAADAARTLLGSVYLVLSWPGGAQAVDKVDFSLIHGRKVLLWPDADDPGRQAMAKVAEKLLDACPEVKILDPGAEPDAKAEGWDAADALAEGWDLQRVVAWARPRARLLERPAPVSPKVEVLPKAPKERIQTIEDVTNQIELTHSFRDKWANAGIAQSGKQPIYNEENVLRIFQNDEFFKDFIWWDEFHKKFFTYWTDEFKKKDTVAHEYTDVYDAWMLTYLQRKWGFSKIRMSQVKTATLIFAHANVRHEVREWVRTLKWDGQKRIDDMFIRGFGAHDGKAYIHQISRNYLIGLIARVFNPGCQYDTMIVLEGPQGQYKTSSLRVLGGKWYSAGRGHVGTPNFYSSIQGKWVIEIAEMASFGKAQIEEIKDMLSTPIDRFRLPYARASEDFPRQCIFAGTTNESNYLRDFTGARRFWPVRCNSIDIPWLKDHREQLFAEAYQAFLRQEKYFDVDKKEAEEEQEKRREADPWEEMIAEFIYPMRNQGVLMKEIVEHIGVPKEKQDVLLQRRIGKILHMLKWENVNVRGLDGIQRRVWKPLDRGTEVGDAWEPS